MYFGVNIYRHLEKNIYGREIFEYFNSKLISFLLGIKGSCHQTRRSQNNLDNIWNADKNGNLVKSVVQDFRRTGNVGQNVVSNVVRDGCVELFKVSEVRIYPLRYNAVISIDAAAFE